MDRTEPETSQQQRQLHAGSRAGHRPGYRIVWVYEMDPDAQVRAEVAWAYALADNAMAAAVAADFDGRL